MDSSHLRPLLQICSKYLPTETILALRLVNTDFKNCIDDDKTLWRHLIIRDFMLAKHRDRRLWRCRTLHCHKPEHHYFPPKGWFSRILPNVRGMEDYAFFVSLRTCVLVGVQDVFDMTTALQNIHARLEKDFSKRPRTIEGYEAEVEHRKKTKRDNNK